MERAGLTKTRDDDRDISEKIALGQAQPNQKEAMYDQRLFNQTITDNIHGEDDDYNLYDQPLFADRSTNIYKSKNLDVNKYFDEDDKQKKVKNIIGEAARDTRGRPVEFEKTKL